jgi:hypothetical protein
MRFAKKLHQSVVPSKANKHRPHLLRHQVIVTVLAVIILVEVGSLGLSFLAFQGNTMLGAILPAVVINLTNDARAQNNLSSLTENPLLTEAAQNVANNMAAEGYFSHVSPSGETPWQWLDDVGYKYQYAGQNLAVNFTDSDQLVSAWLASPEHRANIMGVNYTEIGVGMATGTYQGQQAIFVVQYFASPLVASPAPVQSTPEVAKVIATSAVPVSTSTTPGVLGASTEISTQPQGINGFFDALIASPESTANEIMLGILAFFLVLFILGVLLGSRLPHPSVSVNLLMMVVVVLGILVFNRTAIANSLQIAPNTQDAAIANAF